MRLPKFKDIKMAENSENPNKLDVIIGRLSILKMLDLSPLGEDLEMGHFEILSDSIEQLKIISEG